MPSHPQLPISTPGEGNRLRTLIEKLRKPLLGPRRRFFGLFPAALLLLPQHPVQPGPGPAWVGGVVPLQVRAIQAHRVRILLNQEGLSQGISHSSWRRPIEIRFQGLAVEVHDARSGELLAVGDGLRIEPAPGRLLELEGRPYRGVIEAFFSPGGLPLLVNELAMEDYLPGVVPLELGPVQFPVLEAQRAQSVAARSYALRHLGLRAPQGFDLFADVRSQVYGGQAAEKELSSLGVLSTRGMSLVAAGEPILAYFSSTCGGRTASFAEAFQEPAISYLQGGVECPDQGSPYRDWSAQFPDREFLQRLGLQPVAIEEILLHRYPDGRLDELEVTTGRETRRIPGRLVRNALGLRSTWIVSLTRSSGTVQLQGHGFGHGVGLCQFGSVELGRRGLPAEEILAHYYPGARIQKVY